MKEEYHLYHPDSSQATLIHRRPNHRLHPFQWVETVDLLASHHIHHRLKLLLKKLKHRLGLLLLCMARLNQLHHHLLLLDYFLLKLLRHK